MLSWPEPKDPDEVLDYQVDWSRRLKAGETLVTSEFTAAGSLTFEITDTSLNGGLTTFWAQGGAVGETVRITNRVTTNQGRTYDQTGRLQIRAK